MKKAVFALALLMALSITPGATHADPMSELVSFIVSQQWNGDLNSPLINNFTSQTFGNGQSGFTALLVALGIVQSPCPPCPPPCPPPPPQVAAPEPSTALLTGFFMVMGYRRRKSAGTPDPQV